MNWFNGKKTYIISVLMALTSLTHFMTGESTLLEFVGSNQMVNFFEALGLSTLRVGIQRNQEEATHEIVKQVHYPHAG